MRIYIFVEKKMNQDTLAILFLIELIKLSYLMHMTTLLNALV